MAGGFSGWHGAARRRPAAAAVFVHHDGDLCNAAGVFERAFAGRGLLLLGLIVHFALLERGALPLEQPVPTRAEAAPSFHFPVETGH
jgi:hypothetical protein